MLSILKSKSRTVHHYHEQQGEDIKNERNNEASTSLTIWRKSLLFSCSGFTVIGSDGSLVYRVDNYTGRPQQIILMDGSGDPIFTICRPKKLSLLDGYWLVYEGEVGKYSENTESSSKHKPVFRARKKMTSVTKAKVNVYCGISEHNRCRYVVEGSYSRRSCKILDESRRIVGEIRKKEATRGGVSFGLDVFHLVVRPGFESSFGMAIVVLLDQMFA